MSLIKHLSPTVLMALVAVAGACCALAGVFLLAGLAWTLIVGGAAGSALGLLADV